MWFIGLLLAFFLFFGLVYSLKKSWFHTSTGPATFTPRSSVSTVKLLASVGLLTFVGSSALIFLSLALSEEFNPDALFTLGNIVQFQQGKIVLHITCFIMGVLAYRQKWIERGRFPGRLKALLVFFKADDMGAIFDTSKPLVNAAARPGRWQKYYIEFKAPRFENGKRIEPAEFVKVILNGKVVQKNVKMTDGPTKGAIDNQEAAKGPIMLQGSMGPVAFRNLNITVP